MVNAILDDVLSAIKKLNYNLEQNPNYIHFDNFIFTDEKINLKSSLIDLPVLRDYYKLNDDIIYAAHDLQKLLKYSYYLGDELYELKPYYIDL